MAHTREGLSALTESVEEVDGSPESPRRRTGCLRVIWVVMAYVIGFRRGDDDRPRVACRAAKDGSRPKGKDVWVVCRPWRGREEGGCWVHDQRSPRGELPRPCAVARGHAMVVCWS